jgi:predicted AAA+ superfamily ATPase
MTYMIHRLPAMANPDRSTALGRKLYFYDNGIANILAQPSEGTLFENAVFNQLKFLGDLAYYGKGNEHEIDFVLSQPEAEPVGLEVKVHPVQTDDAKLKRIAEKVGIGESWLVGRMPTPGFDQFVWGGLIF